EKNFLLEMPLPRQTPELAYIPSFEHFPLAVKDDWEGMVGNLWADLIQKLHLEDRTQLIGVIYHNPPRYVAGLKRGGGVPEAENEFIPIAGKRYATMQHA